MSDNDIDHAIFTQRFMALTKARVELANQVWDTLSENEQLHPRTSAIEYAARLKKELDSIPVIEEWKHL